MVEVTHLCDRGQNVLYAARARSRQMREECFAPTDLSVEARDTLRMASVAADLSNI